jgi:hypothetical protein
MQFHPTKRKKKKKKKRTKRGGGGGGGESFYLAPAHSGAATFIYNGCECLEKELIQRSMRKSN